MRFCKLNTNLRRVLLQRPSPIVVELDVVGGDDNSCLAQIFGKDAADLAIADEADFPALGITRHGSRRLRFAAKRSRIGRQDRARCHAASTRQIFTASAATASTLRA